jgi:hypothetical protein
MEDIDNVLKKFASNTMEKFNYTKLDRPMDRKEIANRLNLSNTIVGKHLKSGLEKVYYRLKKETDLDPFEICLRMSEMFGVSEDTPEGMKSFISCFPEHTKGEIRRYARERI